MRALYRGLDAHKAPIAMAVAGAGRSRNQLAIIKDRSRCPRTNPQAPSLHSVLLRPDPDRLSSGAFLNVGRSLSSSHSFSLIPPMTSGIHLL